MPGKKEEDQDIVIQDDELENEDAGKKDDGIEIPLDDNGEPLPAETVKKQQEEAEKAKEEDQRKRNAEFAQRRIDREKAQLRQQLEESNRRIAELEKTRGGQSNFGQSQTQNVVKDKQYWEKRLAEDPVTALDEYEDYKYNLRLKQQMDQQEKQKMFDSWHTTLKESEAMALEEFPSLSQEGTPEYELFMDILGKNPEWKTSPIGPMKVIKEMKKQMASGNGDDVISKVQAQAQTNERNRQARIVNQPLSNSRPSPQGNKVVLTREQQKAWEENFKDRGVTRERYASMVKRTDNGGRVEL